MARHPRLHVPDGFYHVTLRGNHQQPIFFRDEDRELLERIVAESIERLAARVHAYCWMTNHVHLLVQVADQPLGRLMLRIASSYARTVQLRLATTGHLFERRYHAVLIDVDRYLLAVLRYIHLNPVKAGLVSGASSYRWSSHTTYLGLKQREWVTTDLALRVLAPRRGEAIRKYRRLMNGADVDELDLGMLTTRRDFPPILGDEAFAARILGIQTARRSGKSLDDLVRECCARFGLTPELLESPSRQRQLAIARAWLAHQAVSGSVASVSAVARRLHRSESALRHLMASHPDASGCK